jgi:hypothetical protein
LQCSGIIIESWKNNTDKIFLAHGGLPYDFTDKNKLPQEFINGVASKNNFVIAEEHGHCMRWTDIYGFPDTIDNKERSLTPNILFQKIGTKILEEAKKIGINMIIRGHEDYSNIVKVMTYNDNKWMNINDFSNLSNTKRKRFDEHTECNGSVFSLFLNNDRLNINNGRTPFALIPVITTSTNTDTGRNITSDGFVIFNFAENMNYMPNCTGGYKYKYKKYDKLNLDIKSKF